MWPASVYQLSTMHLSGPKRKRGRAILSLIFSYLCALVTILELFIMFYVSKRISILQKEAEEEEKKERQKEIDEGMKEGQEIMESVKEAQEEKVNKMVKDQKKHDRFKYSDDMDEGNKASNIPKKDYSSMSSKLKKRGEGKQLLPELEKKIMKRDSNNTGNLFKINILKTRRSRPCRNSK